MEPSPAIRLHVDTDFAGDPDDACALAMLLGWPDVEVLAITTNLDGGGRRAGCARHLLRLAGADDIPVVAGAEGPLGTGERFESTWGDPAYWPESVAAQPAAAGAAVDALEASIDGGATVLAIGALTNLAELVRRRPGRLRGVPVVVMGGWLGELGPGWPRWGPEMDFNLQCDGEAAAIVAGSGAALTWVDPSVAIAASLTTSQLPRLRRSGPVGELLARQSERHGEEHGMGALGVAHAELPDDLVNFHWDPVAAATAVGWPGVRVEERAVEVTRPDGRIRLREAEGAPTCHLVVGIDAVSFGDRWLESVEAISPGTGQRMRGPI